MKARIALIALLTSAVLLGLGCRTTIVGDGGETQATYRLGTLSAQEMRSIDAVYAAAEDAVDELGLSVVQRTKDALQAELVTRDAQDNRITIKLMATGRESTRVEINARPVEKARRIYEAIRTNL